MRLGLIVNPIAGLGGTVALKGTDGEETVRRALALGATPVAHSRTGRALTRLTCARDDVAIVAAAGSMGADLAGVHSFATEVVPTSGEATTSADDTRMAASEMTRRGVELILYAGGDGTTRDIVDVVGTRVPILGIPTGVKMQSGTFARNPESAAEVAVAFLAAREPQLEEAEVLDVDETALRHGRVSSRFYGVASVPADRVRVQAAKVASHARGGELEELCLALAAAHEGLVLYGPGTTTQRILTHLGIDGTLLGVDAVDDGRLVGADLGERELLDLLEGRTARLVLGVVGGQGSLLGRGNQQLSPEVLRRIGLDRIEIVAAADKLLELDPALLHVDTGDPTLDRQLIGYRRVRVGPRRTLMMNVSSNL